MSGRKRTKRKNSDDDFNLNNDDGMDEDDVNKWSCQSCTFMNRAAAYSCSVCGTRKGTSTRRSRVNDNVVEMQKTITDLVQKQVEKEKSISRKRRERSMLKSMTRERSGGPTTSEEMVIKQELVDAEVEKQPANESKSSKANTIPTLRKSSSKDSQVISPPPVLTPVKVISPEFSGASSASALTVQLEPSTSPVIDIEEISPVEPQSTKDGIKNESKAEKMQNNPSIAPPGQPAPNQIQTPIATQVLPQVKISPEKNNTANISININQNGLPSQIPPEESILQHLPERIIKKLNQTLKPDNSMLLAHKKLTGIDPIVAEAEAILLPKEWDCQRVMRGLIPNHYVSPATSRQSSETDSSSEANRSLETPSSTDVSSSPAKSCQIPDYMIHRDAPQKIFIVANGFPAYFEEFPKRIPSAQP